MEATCSVCGSGFTYVVRGRGSKPNVCSDECRAEGRRRAVAKQRAGAGMCLILECSNAAQNKASGLCPKHYARLRRTGETELRRRPIKGGLVQKSGYVLAYVPGHPLAIRAGSNHVREHRVVFYDRHGEGPFCCHWCGRPVTWRTMHVDHVNADRGDNRIENLVASCPRCNQARGLAKLTRAARRLWGKPIEWNGQSRTLSEWSDVIGISRSALQWRIDHGWDLDRVFTTPRGKQGPAAKARIRPWRLEAAA